MPTKVTDAPDSDLSGDELIAVVDPASPVGQRVRKIAIARLDNRFAAASALGAKADTATVNAELAAKADTADLAAKADTAEVNAAFARKAETAALTAQLEAKAPIYRTYGTTAERPTFPVGVGGPFYDATLSKALFGYNPGSGTVWVDMNTAALSGGSTPTPSTFPGFGTPQRLIGVGVEQTNGRTSGFASFAGRGMSYGTVFGAQNQGATNAARWQGMNDGASYWADLVKDEAPLHWALPLNQTGSTLAQVAAGNFDSYFNAFADIALAAALQANNGRANDAIIPVRPGWEAQLMSWAWGVQGNEADYIAAFRRVAGLLRAKSPKFAIEWNVNQQSGAIGGGVYNPDNFYPGDAYVDVMSMDVYGQTEWDVNSNGAATVPAPTAAQQISMFIKKVQASTYGLNWLTNAARTRGKPVAIPEWGINGDCPFYVSLLAEFMRDHPFLYQMYFDWPLAPNANWKISSAVSSPAVWDWTNARARYLKEFGASRNETNLATFLSDWGLSGVTRTATGISDAFGGTNAIRLLETATTADHQTSTGIIKTTGARVQRSFVGAKPVNGRYGIRIQLSPTPDFGSGAIYEFNLTNGTVQANGSYGSITGVVPFCIPMENGYYKCGFEFTSTADTTYDFIIKTITGSGAASSFLGDVTKGVDLCNAWHRDLG